MIPIPIQSSFSSFYQWFKELSVLYPLSVGKIIVTPSQSWQSIVLLLRLRFSSSHMFPIPSSPLYKEDDWKKWINDFRLLNQKLIE